MAFIGSLRCSRTKNVRCAARSLASRHLLGTESDVFCFLFIKVKKKLACDDDVSLCNVFGIEYGIHREGTLPMCVFCENTLAHVPKTYAAFLVP